MKAQPYSIGSDVWPGISKLIEEAGEVQQVCGKIIGRGGEVEHWDGTNLETRICEELADLKAAIAFVENHCMLDSFAINERAQQKLEVFSKWHEEASK